MADSNFTNLGVVEEVTFGTTPASALQLLRRTGGNITPRRSTTTSDEIRSDLRAGKPVRTSQWCEGDVNVEWSYGSFGLIQQGLLMEDYASNVLVDGTTEKSFTFEDQIVDDGISPNQYMIYKGCRIAGLTLSCATESIVTGSFGVMGATPSIAQASAGTGAATAATTTEVWNCVDMVTGIEEAASGSTAASLSKVQGVDLSIQRALRTKMEIGNLNPFDIGVGRLMVTGTITQYFEDDRLMDAWFAFTDRLLNLEFTDSAGNVLLIEIPKIKLVGDAAVDIPGPDSDVMATYNFEAYADVGDTALIRFTRTPA